MAKKNNHKEKRESEKDAPSPWRSTLDWVKSISIAIGIALLFRWPVAEPFKIPSGSMEPTLHGDMSFLKGDRIFVNKHAYGIRYPFNGFRIPGADNPIWYTDKWLWEGDIPERWDIVVFKAVVKGVDHDTLVKRVVGLPGERINISNGKIHVNGEPLELPDSMPDIFYTNPGIRDAYGITTDDAHSLVPEGHVFVLGDNSASSLDARWWGWLPHHHILGEVTSIWWPMSRWRDFTGFSHSWWWIGTWSLFGLYIFMRLFLGRSVKVFGEGFGGLIAHGEHVFIRFALGIPIPFTGKRVGRGHDPERGEVVLYRPPAGVKNAPQLLLGIVAGLPKERVFLDSGKLQADGAEVIEPQVFSDTEFSGNGKGKFGVSRSKEHSLIPEDHYYLLSDGAEEFSDSRSLGWIPRERIVGTAIRVWMPITRGRSLRNR